MPVPAAVVPLDRLRVQKVSWQAAGAAMDAHRRSLEDLFSGAAPAGAAGGGVPSFVWAAGFLLVALLFAVLALRPRKTAPDRTR